MDELYSTSEYCMRREGRTAKNQLTKDGTVGKGRPPLQQHGGALENEPDCLSDEGCWSVGYPEGPEEMPVAVPLRG